MFFDRLKELCEEKGTTVTAMLKSLNISPSKATAWKYGSMPRADVVTILAERCQTGKTIAKENNPFFVEGRPRIKKIKIDNALEMLDKHSVSEVVKITGISRATIMRYKRNRNAETAAI